MYRAPGCVSGPFWTRADSLREQTLGYTSSLSHQSGPIDDIPFDIVLSDDFWECKGPSDGRWYPNLIDAQDGIGGNDRPRGKVHTLAHEIASHSALLSFQSLCNRLDGLLAALQLGLAVAVVHVPGDVLLQLYHHLLLNMWCRTLLLKSGKVIANVDNLGQLNCQVILQSHNLLD